MHKPSDGAVPDWKDNEHIYLQLKDLVLRQIMLGTLLEGEPVPSVRQVASQERINPLTVSRAYHCLLYTSDAADE